jgi:hypothetical protein
MSKKAISLPCRGFALFALAGAVQVRTVNVTGLHELFDAASVTEAMTGIGHVLPLARVASAQSLTAKKAAFAATLNFSDAAPATCERHSHTMPVLTTETAAAL